MTRPADITIPSPDGALFGPTHVRTADDARQAIDRLLGRTESKENDQ